MQRIPEGSIDCIITDLPYGTTACKWDCIIPFEPMWAQFKRVCKPNAAIVLFGAEPFSSMLRMSNIEWYKYDYTWVKTKASGFQNAKIQPMRKHENVMVFYKSQPTFNQQHLVKLDKPIESGRKRLRNEEQHRLGVAGKEHKTTHTGWQDSVLNFSNPSGAGHLHPTMKPVELISYLMRIYSNEGDTVLDATIGSGTTAIAAIRENRHFIGFELNKEYYDKACERIKRELQQPMLDFK